MTDTPEHLEREIEARRASVEETLERLKDRMSLDRIVDEVGHFVGITDVRATLRAAGDNVRANPVSIGLIGAGVAWMFLAPRLANGGGSEHPSDNAWRSRRDHGDDWRQTYAGDNAPQRQGTMSRLGEKVGDATDKVKSVASTIGDTVGSATHAVTSYASDARESASAMAGRIKDRAERAIAPVSGQLQAHPLAIGALAIAAGAIVGSALPRTEPENRLLSKPRDRLLDEAKAASREVADRVKDAARASLDAAAEAAREEGLLPEGGRPTLAEKVEHVATAALEQGKEKLQAERA